MNINWKMGFSGVFVSLVLLTACEDEHTFSADEIVQQALEENRDVQAYYMESVMSSRVGDEQSEQMTMKEWYKRTDEGIWRRIESHEHNGPVSYVVTDNDQSITYTEGDDEAHTIDIDGLYSEQNNMSEYEYVLNMLENYRDTHDIKLEGTSEVNGRDAYHLHLVPHNENDLRGEQEYWIDKDTWFTLRTEMIMGDIRVELEVTELEIDPPLEDDLFTLELPDHVITTDLPDIDSFRTEIEMQDVPNHIEADFLHVTDPSYELENIYVYEYDAMEQVELTMDYTQDGEPQFHLSIISRSKSDNESGAEEDITIPGEENIDIRGAEGSVMSIDQSHFISWEEDGLRYNLSNMNPNLSMDDLLELTDQLTVYEP